MIYNAWVKIQLWVWFVTPTFGIAAPSLVMMIGISLLLAMFFLHLSQDKDDGEGEAVHKFVKIIMKLFLVPTVFWGMGWVVHLFA